MLKDDAQSLHLEFQDSIEFFKKRHKATERMIEAYQTPWHKGQSENNIAQTVASFDSKNHALEYIALTIADVVFDNPRFQITAKRGYAASVDAPALQDGLNSVVKEIKLKKILARCYVDYCFSHCCSMVYRQEIKQMSAQAGQTVVRPRVRNLGKRAFRDHRVFEPEDARYIGHTFIMDKEDALNDPSWNHAAVKDVPAGAGVRELRGETAKMTEGVERNEMACIEAFVPEHDLDEKDRFWRDVPDEERALYTGTIYTLPLLGVSDGTRNGVSFLRPPRPWYGHPSGPYQWGGTYPVPDDPMYLSLLKGVEGQNRQNNMVARALFDAIVEYKRLILTSHRKPSLQALISRAKHGSVVSADLQDLQRMLANIEVGGPTPALIQAGQILQESTDRASGISEAFRGNVTGDATAFENSVAAAGAGKRMAYPKQQFADFTGEIGEAMAWYLHYDDQVAVDLDGAMGTMFGGAPMAHANRIMQALQERGVPEQMAGAYLEFAEKQYRMTPWGAFGFGIEPLSTERASDPGNRQRVLAVVPLILQLAQAAPMLPWINMKEVMSWIGQAFDLPDLARIYNEKIAALATQNPMMAQPASGAAMGSTVSTGQPRLAGDIGGGAGAPQPAGQRGMPFRGPGTPGRPTGPAGRKGGASRGVSTVQTA